MKLRNKKTGEIKEGVEISIWLDHEGTLKFRSLAELNEEWEDNVALLTDNLKLECFKLWCRANDVSDYSRKLFIFDHAEHRLTYYNTCIEFDTINGLERLEDGKNYSYNELCGEEEK